MPKPARIVLALTIAATGLLSGCAEVIFKPACPAQTTYSAEFQARAAAALPGATPEHRVMIEDYGDLRARCRAISAAR